MALSHLRLRLAGGFALAFGIGLALLALASLGYLWRESRSRLDARLDGVARGVADAVRREALETPDSTLVFAVREVLAEWPRTGDHWMVTDEGGALLAATDTVGDPRSLARRALATDTARAELNDGTSDIRIALVSGSVVLRGSTTWRYRVMAFGSTQGIEQDTEALATALAIAAPLIVLLSLEVAATLLLLGAQVIAEYESIETGVAEKPPVPVRTEAV